jgi:polar amino acid transport system ATP-binding protein
MDFAREVADRVIVLHEGELIEQGPPQNLFGSPQDPRTRTLLERYRPAAEPA